jgi:hypothetical protein
MHLTQEEQRLLRLEEKQRQVILKLEEKILRLENSINFIVANLPSRLFGATGPPTKISKEELDNCLDSLKRFL